MRHPTERFLIDMSVDRLYRLIGDAWIAQLRPKVGQGYFLDRAEEIGRREFATFLPHIQDELTRSAHASVLACVSDARRRAGTWAIPEMVVVEITLRMLADKPVVASASSTGARQLGLLLRSPPPECTV